MNENLESVITIKSWTQQAQNELLAVGIDSSRLDAEIILSFVIHGPRTYLHAHPEQRLAASDILQANSLLSRRIKRMPIAYIVGHKEFYGRDFMVTKDVLIPRPESEAIIDTLKSISINPSSRVYDIGTGSGCLGITAKLEMPNLDTTLCDISQKSLNVAQKNSIRLQANVKIIKSNLLSDIKLKPDIIIANLPYVDQTWKRSKETDYEPPLALFAKNNGLELIQKLVNQASMYKNITLILELDPVQQEPMRQYANQLGFRFQRNTDYVITLKN